MSEDDEINAMKQIAAALAPLNDAAKDRALQWAFSRFKKHGALGTGVPIGRALPSGTGGQQFASFPELFAAGNPATEREKALLAAYWTQICEAQESFASQTLNDALKNLGHGIGNITEALTALKDERPALILQLKKSGTSRQARKTYKLTQEGIRRVHELLQRPADDNA